MPSSDSYIIRGGEEGRERLRVLSRVLGPTTGALLDRVGVPADAECLDVGCGGGDVTVELCRRGGRVVGVDVDVVKLDIAREDAAAAGYPDIEFRVEDVTAPPPEADVGRFDVVYARFVLSHLTEPAAAVQHLATRLAPGGVVVVEDIDFRGHFCDPGCAAFDRFVRWFTDAAIARGVDPNLGSRLPALLRGAGVDVADMNVVQPAGFRGELKLMAENTLAAIADSVVNASLASAAEIAATLDELASFAGRDDTVMSLPRIVQAWGRRP